MIGPFEKETSRRSSTAKQPRRAKRGLEVNMAQDRPGVILTLRLLKIKIPV